MCVTTLMQFAVSLRSEALLTSYKGSLWAPPSFIFCRPYVQSVATVSRNETLMLSIIVEKGGEASRVTFAILVPEFVDLNDNVASKAIISKNFSPVQVT